MTRPVENFAKGNSEVEADLLPQLEALARLYELIERYNASDVNPAIATAAARHRALTGHSLRYGCCRDKPLDKVIW